MNKPAGSTKRSEDISGSLTHHLRMLAVIQGFRKRRNPMYTIDDIANMLDNIVDEIPLELFKDLNGGIILLEEYKTHPESPGNLFILGEYHHRYDMGRYICIYYGSFMHLYRHLRPEKLRARLKETLLHEFTHHLESLAGEKGLEIQDKIDLQRYRQFYRKP